MHSDALWWMDALLMSVHEMRDQAQTRAAEWEAEKESLNQAIRTLQLEVCPLHLVSDLLSDVVVGGEASN